MADPSVIRSVAVHTDDIVSAYEAARGGRPAVIRLTPPFVPRMRGRLHLADVHDDPDAIHLPPSALLADSAPPYPTPDSTEQLLREREESVTTEQHHEFHTERVAAWRSDVRTHIVETISIDTDAGVTEADIKPLG